MSRHNFLSFVAFINICIAINFFQTDSGIVFCCLLHSDFIETQPLDNRLLNHQRVADDSGFLMHVQLVRV